MEYYIQQQEIEKEKLEKRVNKLKYCQEDELEAQVKQMLEEESEAIKKAEEVTELDKMKKKMINHVQNELDEHNEALQRFLEKNKDGDKGGKKNKKRQQKGKKNKEAIGGVGGKKDQYDSMDSDNDDEESSGSSRKGNGSRNRKGNRSRKNNEKSEGQPNLNIKNGTVWNYDGPNNGKDDSSRVQLDILKDPRYFHFSNEFGVGFTDDGGVFFPKITDFKFDE